jgi:hypothetical protein
MKEKLDLLGAIVAHVVLISSIITFSSRMLFNLKPGHWVGITILLVMLYFAGAGGMIGIAALAGRGWMISAVILFFIAAILAFVQLAVTGI